MYTREKSQNLLIYLCQIHKPTLGKESITSKLDFLTYKVPMISPLHSNIQVQIANFIKKKKKTNLVLHTETQGFVFFFKLYVENSMEVCNFNLG